MLKSIMALPILLLAAETASKSATATDALESLNRAYPCNSVSARLQKNDSSWQITEVHIWSGCCNAMNMSLQGLKQFASLEALVIENETNKIPVETQESAFKNLKNLKRFVIIGRVSAADFTAICSLPCLLQLEMTLCGDSNGLILNDIRKCDCLRRLGLHGAVPFSVDTVDAISAIKSLEELSVSGTNIRDDSLDGLNKLAGLKALDLSCTQVGDRVMPNIDSLHELQSLNLESTAVTDQAIGSIKHLSKLRQLNIGDTTVSGNSLPSLMNINLFSLTVGASGMNADLSPFRKLEELHCSSRDGIGKISFPPTIKKLSGYVRNKDDVAAVTTQKCLRSVHLYTPEPNTVLEEMERLRSLEELHLTYTNEGLLASLRRVSRIRSLILEDCRQTYNGHMIESIGCLHNLEVLRFVAWSEMSLKDLECLAELHGLGDLGLDGIDKGCLQELMKIPVMPSLKRFRVDIRGEDEGGDFVKALNIGDRFMNLEDLSVRNGQLNDDWVESLKKLKKLKRLDLRNSRGVSTEKLAEVLENLQGLNEVFLGNRATDSIVDEWQEKEEKGSGTFK